MKKIWTLLACVCLAFQLQAQKQKVILDCDLGDDIDDAFALALLLSSTDKFEILGITTCYGRTNDRAEMACKMLYETGNEKIPVAVGRNTANTDERANWYADQFYWSKGFNKVKPITEPAADFYYRTTAQVSERNHRVFCRSCHEYERYFEKKTPKHWVLPNVLWRCMARFILVTTARQQLMRSGTSKWILKRVNDSSIAAQI